MSNIEENIKRCEQLTEARNANWIGISNQLAIAHIVDRIKELEENSIPVQKVIDKININNNIMLETKNKYPSTYTALDEWRNAKAQNEVLEKILEEK